MDFIRSANSYFSSALVRFDLKESLLRIVLSISVSFIKMCYITVCLCVRLH